MEEDKQPLHFHLHIEKTGGTSVMEALIRQYGKEHVYYYNPTNNTLKPTTEAPVVTTNFFNPLLALLAETPIIPFLAKYFITYNRPGWPETYNQPPTIPEQAGVVVGHYLLDLFDPDPDKSIITTVIREPLERMASQYFHWKRAGGHAKWRVNIPWDEQMTFEKFAMLPKLKDYQTQALAGVKLDRLATVGTTDNMPDFLNRMFKRLSPYENVNEKILDIHARPNPKKANLLPKISQGFISEFKDQHQQDYQLYQHALQLSKT